MSVLSLYVPVIQTHVTEAYIKRQFLDHNIGKVMRVDFVKNISKTDVKRLFILMSGLITKSLKNYRMISRILTQLLDLFIITQSFSSSCE